MSKKVRQYLGILTALVSYYLIHEGAHLAVALYYGVFQRVNFLGLGIQIAIIEDGMTETQLGIFCLVGAVATAVTGWLLVLLCDRICRFRSPLLKAMGWYTTICMLLLDPIYLSVLYGFFGGGDMNGIRMLLPELPTRIGFVLLGIAGGITVWKYLLPRYTRAFQETQ